MKALLIPLILEGPVLITCVGNGEENSSRTLPYLPGSALRGALVSRYITCQDDLLQDKTAVRLFFSQEVIYLNAYPNCRKQRSLPTPASWHKEKGARMEDVPAAYDFALASNEAFDQRVGRPFCDSDLSDMCVTLLKPDEELTTHISGEERGIVKSANNTVFQYQALARGQTFTAVILAQNSDDRDTIETLLKQNSIFYLGRSRSARYGRVRVDLNNIKKIDQWQEAASHPLDDRTVITLLSDALLRDENGQPTHDLDGWLARRLGKNVKHFKSQQRFVNPALVGAFNRKWGLPLPQFPALGMGSVFVYSSDLLKPQELADLVRNGIGERQVEGFGRVAVNWQHQGQFRIEDGSPAIPAAHTELSASSLLLAGKMAERILRQRLDAHLSEITHTYKISGNINNHQLARLRGQLRRVLNQGDLDLTKITGFIDKLKPTAIEQYRRARIQYQDEKPVRLLTWLEDRLKQPTQGIFGNVRIPNIAGQKAQFNDEIKTEYALRLVEAVINRRMKENREVSQ